jgi:peptidyl-prolyl cis-trans isomerase C
MIQKMIQPVLVATLALSLVQLTSIVRAATSDASTNLFADPVVATGKGFEVKRSEVDESFLNYSGAEAARGTPVPDAERTTVRAKLLDHLIIDRILLQMATPAERGKIENNVDTLIKEARTNDPAGFEAQIKASGLPLEQMRNRAVDQQLCKLVLVRETTNGITVSDEAAKKFYTDNPTDFEIPVRVHVAHILISTMDPLTQSPLPPEKKKDKEKLAKDLKSRAEKGEDFAKLVKEYTDDPGSKAKNGEYTFARNHQMVPEFEAAAFSLKTNQISDLVETRFGYHIIKLIETLPAATEPFAEASPRIREFLVGQQANKGLDAYLDKLKANANVKVLDQSLSDVGLDKLRAPGK